VGAPGNHGIDVIGMQGAGVNTPIAAAVAAATIGFAAQEQRPKGITFTNGMWSMTVATGVPAWTKRMGSTLNTLGAAPNGHCNNAPAEIKSAI